jgi:plastocyanin domain-containing protein
MNKLSLIILTICLGAYSLSSLSLEYADDPFLKAHNLEAPLREFSIISSSEGFYPQNIVAFEGEKIKLFLTTISKNPSCLMIPSKNVFLGATQGKMAEAELLFEKAGTYEFFCPSGKIKGKIQVLKRQTAEQIQKREIASELKLRETNIPVRVWRPSEMPSEE